MTRSSHVRGYLLVLAATVLWSTLGAITRILLDRYHFPPLSIPFLRSALASTAFFIGLLFLRRDLLRPPPGTLRQLVVLGVFGVAAFYVSLTKGVELAGIALLSVLAYMAPTWVSIVGALFLNEPLTPRKIVALALSLAGCALAVKVYDPAAMRLSLPGILAGLSASVGYAFFAVFSKTLNGKCDSRTMLMYAYGIAAVVLLPLQGQGLQTALQPATWPFLVAMVAGPTLGAWMLFSIALRWVPVSNATIITSVDAVFSNIIAYALFSELLDFPQMIGGALILAAVILLQIEPAKAEQPSPASNHLTT